MLDAPQSPIFTIRVSVPRCVFGIGVTTSLGLLLFAISIVSPPANPLWLVFLWIAGAAAFWGGWALFQTARDGLELTQKGLFSINGDLICRLEDIRSVERSFGTFKPSGGFLIRLHKKGTRAWVPGLWWRLGRTIGVGGATRSGEVRAMAEMLAQLKAKSEAP